MQLNQLVVFKKVAEVKSFSQAAEDLYLSQSTVSTHVTNLELFLGKRLLDRLGKQVQLTPFGERVYSWAERIVNLHNSAIDDLKNFTNDLSGTLNIAASTVPAQYMAPKVMAEFKKRFPAVTFIIRQGSSEQVADLLLKGQADLGIVGEVYYPDKLSYLPFHHERLVLIAPSSMQLSNPVSLVELKNLEFIFRSPGSGTQATIERTLRKAHIDVSQFKVAAYLDSVQAVKEAVKDGLGVAIISELAVKEYGNRAVLNVSAIKEFSDLRPFYFAYHKHRSLTAFVDEFIATGVKLYSESSP